MYPNQQVTQLRKSGQLDEAYQVGMEALQESPGDLWLRRSVAWVHYEYIKHAVEAMETSLGRKQPLAPVTKELVHRYLKEYSNLQLERPDMAYSQIIRLLAKVGAQLEYYVPFLAWGGVDAFSEEDCAPFEMEEGSVPSLMTRVAREAMAWCGSHTSAQSEWGEFVSQLANRAILNSKEASAHRVWLFYDRADLNHRMGRTDAAIADMREVLKGNQREFWAWGRMGRIHSELDPVLAIACYCQALGLNPDPKFTVKHRLFFAKLLYSQGEQAAAITEYLTVANIYQREEWAFPADLEAALQADWFDSSLALDNPDAFYRERSSAAQALLYEDVAQVDATFLRKIKQERNGATRWSIVGAVRKSQSLMPEQLLLRWQKKHPPDFKAGEPFRVTLGKLDGRQQQLGISSRPEGEPWDCLSQLDGLLISLNKESTRGGVFLNVDTEAVLISEQDYSGLRLSIGDGIRVQTCCNPAKENRLEAYAPEKLQAPPALEGVEFREGTLKVHDSGFGFVGSDVFVPPPLVDKTLDGLHVHALSVWKKKPRKQEYGWTAVTIEPCISADHAESTE